MCASAAESYPQTLYLLFCSSPFPYTHLFFGTNINDDLTINNEDHDDEEAKDRGVDLGRRQRRDERCCPSHCQIWHYKVCILRAQFAPDADG